MIPVLGVPILSGRQLLVEMLDSLDTDTEQVIIVDNGGVAHGLSETPFCTVITLPHNIGCGAGWNLILKVTPEAPWWALVNHDVVFGPGDLDRMTVAMEADMAVVVNFGNFSAFALNRAALNAVGYFDENFHPAYFEDNDYAWRCGLAGVPVVQLPSGIRHVGSATIQSNPMYRKSNSRTFVANQERYIQKWGGTPRQEKFMTPFDRGGDIRDVTLDPERLKALAWSR